MTTETSPAIPKLMADLVLIQRQIAILLQTGGDSSILLESGGQDFLSELNTQKGYYIKKLLEARARGEVSLGVCLYKFPDEQLHPWSRNNFDLRLPHPISAGAIYSVRSNLHGTAAYSDTDSQDILHLLQTGNPPLEQTEDTADNFVVRRFYEIETIAKLMRARRKGHVFEEATQLQDLSAELAIGILQLRDNKRKGLNPQTNIPMRVGLVRDSRHQAAMEIQLKLRYSYDRGEQDHSLFMPVPALQKMKYRATLQRLVIPYDFIQVDRLIPFAS